MKLKPIKFTPDHIEEFKELMAKTRITQDEKGARINRDPIDLLPFLRRIQKDPLPPGWILYIDQPFLGIQYKQMYSVYQNKSPLRIILWNEDGDHPGLRYLGDTESDYLMASLHFRNLPRNLPKASFEYYSTILTYCMVLIISDCSGCCNAFKYFNLTNEGIIAEADLRMTYHS